MTVPCIIIQHERIETLLHDLHVSLVAYQRSECMRHTVVKGIVDYFCGCSRFPLIGLQGWTFQNAKYFFFKLSLCQTPSR
jgi:hypothetical protein